MSGEPPISLRPASRLSELRAIEDTLAQRQDAPAAELALLHRDAVYTALDLGDLAAAMTHALRCLELARACADGPLEVKARVALALVQAETYDDLGADRQFRIADRLAREHGDDRGVALVAVNASHYHLERGQHSAAISLLTRLLASRHARGLELPQSRQLLESFHINFVVGASEALLADRLRGSRREAVTGQLETSVALLRQLDADREEGPLEASLVLDALTRHALWRGDRDEARHLADEHVRLAEQAESPLLYGRALLDRSRVWASTGDWPAAIGDALRAVEHFGGAGDDLWEGRAREALAGAYASAGLYREAFETQQDVTRSQERLYRAYHQQRALVGQIEQQAREAEVRAQALAEAALRDPLTGGPNRTRAMQMLDDLHGRALQGFPSAIALVDLDHFKHVNDTYGHLVGDAVLIQATRLLTRELRDQDLLARLGGEEFLVLMTDVGVEVAATVCERLRAALQGANWDSIAPGLRTSGSFGVALLDGRLDTVAVLQAADNALYAAKAAGRNAVQVAPSRPRQGLRP
ncbi:GGDEF domain-containing protein [Deinococcus koreensis]|uniref:GGDEF domain-containing protein n=1 Tax=Deinococcus koreensis TaxID=2054903 RepID=A0A2K3V0D3_9DEIO|nr:GGDEF domain-containing protein [Deinococcus koreensis]PNY82235.1 GGDEF domain-containing protein [Deinococcus koreensis]